MVNGFSFAGQGQNMGLAFVRLKIGMSALVKKIPRNRLPNVPWVIYDPNQ